VKIRLRHIPFLLLWGAVAAYVVYASATARRQRSACVVQRLDIEIADSTAHGLLVSASSVREWIARAKIPTIGTAAGEVDLTAVEQLIARNGFVDRVAAYVDHAGVLHVEIRPREPLLRLLTDGVNAYVTADGTVFAAPHSSSLYVPVVTGPYRPPFPADYAGRIRDCTDAELQRIDGRIAELEREKYPLYRREAENRRNLAALRRMRIKRRWWRGESASEFEARVAELRSYKAQKRRDCRYEAQQIRLGIERIEERQRAERAAQKKLEKSYEDFMKLLTFVQSVEKDDFWRSEVVQIVARTTSSGALEIDLVPRSGRHIVRFGRLERVEEKFGRLMHFYRRGLSRIGWDEYRTIDVRFDGQVVCRK